MTGSGTQQEVTEDEKSCRCAATIKFYCPRKIHKLCLPSHRITVCTLTALLKGKKYEEYVTAVREE